MVDGILKRDAQVRVLRDGAVIYTSKLNSLKRFKDDASEVRTGFECGAGVANFNDVKVGDILECFMVSFIPLVGDRYTADYLLFLGIPGAYSQSVIDSLFALQLNCPHNNTTFRGDGNDEPKVCAHRVGGAGGSTQL